MIWLQVRVLPGPPRSHVRTGVSLSLTNSPNFSGVSAVQIPGVRSLAREDGTQAVWRVWSLASEIRFPAPGEGRGQKLGSHATHERAPQNAGDTDASDGLDDSPGDWENHRAPAIGGPSISRPS